jgi:NTE family protein
MFRRRLVPVLPPLIILFASLVAYPGFQAAAGEYAPEMPTRRKIGLVLSGGGARGAAHIGVIKVLEELRVPIDCIAGTSMGAIVGGLYASGMSIAELEKTLTRVDWSDAFLDDIPREDRSFRRKRDDDLYLLKAKAGLRDDGAIALPAGVLQGQKLDQLFKGLTFSIEGTGDFDHLPIPFRAVATDIVTGREMVLGRGDLAMAMRASMSVPAVFAPVEIDGRLLVDGGLSNNLPMDVARRMGADVLIVVDISTPLSSRDELRDALAITGQLTNFLTRGNTEAQLATLGKEDILLVPNLEGISSSDFARAGEAIPRGLDAAGKQRQALSRLASEANDYQAYQMRRLARNPAMPVVEFVHLDNRSRVSDEVLRSRIRVRTGEPLDTAALEADIARIYGLELFENIRYEIVEEEGCKGVVLHVQERRWGPNYLQFGLSSSNNFQGDSTLNFGLAYTRTAINSLAGEWRTAIQLGRDPSGVTELYQPLDADSRYFINPALYYRTVTSNQFVAGKRQAEYRTGRYGAILAGGRELGTWGEMRLGYNLSVGESEMLVGDHSQPDRDFTNAEAFVRLALDTLNEIPFPSKGNAGALEFISSQEAFASDSDYNQAKASWLSAGTWGRYTLVGSLLFDTTLDSDAPLESLFSIGGLFRLSGFAQDELSGQHSGLLRLIAFRRFGDFALLPIYVGGSLEQGNVWDRYGEIEPGNTLTAGSLFLGADTPIGPIYLGYGMAEGSHESLYLYLGKLF